MGSRRAGKKRSSMGRSPRRDLAREMRLIPPIREECVVCTGLYISGVLEGARLSRSMEPCGCRRCQGVKPAGLRMLACGNADWEMGAWSRRVRAGGATRSRGVVSSIEVEFRELSG